MKLAIWIRLKIKQNFKCKHELTPIGRMRYSDLDGFTFMFQEHKCYKCGKVKDVHMYSDECGREFYNRYKW